MDWQEMIFGINWSHASKIPIFNRYSFLFLFVLFFGWVLFVCLDVFVLFAFCCFCFFVYFLRVFLGRGGVREQFLLLLSVCLRVVIKFSYLSIEFIKGAARVKETQIIYTQVPKVNNCKSIEFHILGKGLQSESLVFSV